MKKLLVLPLFILLFSCGAVKPALPSEFAADVVIAANGREYSAVYEKRLYGDYLKFTAPEGLCGMELFLKDGVCTVKMEELSFDSDGYKAVFDFLPVESEAEKTVGFRNYRIFNLREIK